MSKRRRVYLVLTLAMLCFIWGNSSMSGAASGALSGRFLKYLAPLLAPFGNKAEFVLRKLAHFSEFTLLGFLLAGLTRPETPAPWRTRPFFLGLAAACIDETIDSLTKGYDTIVGERGVTLSGGQKQRAAIARTLTRKTPILVFDDSLSAVDAQTDVLIRTRLRERMKDSTVILISHRITTLMEADQIMVMDKGRVTQLGTHEELMKQEGGMYRRIYDLQMSLKEEEDA